MYAYACRSEGDNINIFSLKLLRVAAILDLIITILDRILIMTEYAVILAEFSYFLATIVNIILMTIYFVKCYKALKGIENMIKTGIPEVCISNYIIVMNFLIVIFSALDIAYYGLSIPLLFLKLVFMIFFIIVLFTLRKDLQNLRFKISIHPELAEACEKTDESLNNII